ncbi:MAG: excinuclease ABC subunit UvrA, partial [Hyphomonas sp.]|nr:excinuclease ABC subunit UvrA [Hyphomonas sp.]
MAESPFIRVRGAKEHNLKNVDVDIPRGELVVMTGLSGSGKSSLAFDTIYAEGQRRYVESLSAYARQFLELMQKPDVESIEGLSPAISIEQKTTSRNPRSTVGTVTEIYDYMRLLWARVGIPYSPATGLPIQSQTISQMVDRTMALPEGTRLYLLAPIVRGRKGEYRKEFAELLKNGYQRVKVDGEFHELENPPKLDKKFKHDIDVVVDRIVVREGMEQRLAESFETAIGLADGIAIGEYADIAEGQTEPERITYSANFACPVSGFTIPEIEPRLFSFNNPFGACPTCDGLGEQLKVDVGLVVPDKDLDLLNGAIAPWAKSTSPYQTQTLQALSAHYRFDLNKPWNKLPESIHQMILFGTGEEEINFVYDDGMRRYEVKKTFEGVIPNLERRYRETDSQWVRDEIAKFQAAAPCPACGGKRLKPQALAVKIDGLDISDASVFSIKEAHVWFGQVHKSLTKQQNEIAGRILKEINDRLDFLNDVGLEYLTLSRASGTLSGGESQRIRLASQIGSGLTGVLYVLDEPSIGLHPRDNHRLIGILRGLRRLGNTVVVVEHDPDIIRASDYVLDLGPRAGEKGGEIQYFGPTAGIDGSLTGQYLRGLKTIAVPYQRRPPDRQRQLQIKAAAQHNLKNIDVAIPLGLFVVLTGVSGSGKSTLAEEIIYRALKKSLGDPRGRPGKLKKLQGADAIGDVVLVDQRPIGRTPRANALTYT